MSYRYEFDGSGRVDWNFFGESYRSIQDGLRALLEEVRAWNERAVAEGARGAPYEREQGDLEHMIAFGDEELRKDPTRVRIRGMSIGSLRYLRGGLELVIRRRREAIRKHRMEGWPSGALESVEEGHRELEKLAETMEVQPAAVLWEVLPVEDRSEIVEQMRGEQPAGLWDAFISHASDDKEAFVRPLAEALRNAGLRLWYDEYTLTVGDRLRRSIDRGLSRSRYGIVVLSPAFFAKEWPQRELDGLAALEIDDRKVVLPVWHGMDVTEVSRYSPMLADRIAARSADGVEAVVRSLLAVIAPDASRDA